MKAQVTFRHIGHLDFGTCEPWDFRTFEPSDPWTLEVLIDRADPRIFGPLDLLIFEPPV